MVHIVHKICLCLFQNTPPRNKGIGSKTWNGRSWMSCTVAVRCESGLDEQRSSTRTLKEKTNIATRPTLRHDGHSMIIALVEFTVGELCKIQIRPRCQPSKEITGNWSTLTSRRPSKCKQRRTIGSLVISITTTMKGCAQGAVHRELCTGGCESK